MIHGPCLVGDPHEVIVWLFGFDVTPWVIMLVLLFKGVDLDGLYEVIWLDSKMALVALSIIVWGMLIVLDCDMVEGTLVFGLELIIIGLLEKSELLYLNDIVEVIPWVALHDIFL